MSFEQISYRPKPIDKVAGAAAALVLTTAAFTGFGFKKDNAPKATVTLVPVLPTVILVNNNTFDNSPTVSQVITDVTPKNEIQIGRKWEGQASYYSRDGCIGCSPDMIMANGKPLDDSQLTAAFNRADLGTKLRITDRENGNSVIVEVTDRGGFEKLGRIIDLSLAAKNSLNCTDLADVLVEEIIS